VGFEGIAKTTRGGRSFNFKDTGRRTVEGHQKDLWRSRDDVDHKGANRRVTARNGTSELRLVKPADGKILSDFSTAPRTHD
jgi:hypothetical protein